jgi:hypothetical protein
MLNISEILRKRITKVVILILLLLAIIITAQTFWKTAHLNTEVKTRIVSTLLNRSIEGLDILLSENPNVQKLATVLLTPEDFERKNINKKIPGLIEFMNGTPGIDAFSATIDSSSHIFITTEKHNYVKLVKNGEVSYLTLLDGKLKDINVTDIDLQHFKLLTEYQEKIASNDIPQTTWQYHEFTNNATLLPYLISSTEWKNATTNGEAGKISIYINANELLDFFERQTALGDEEIFIIKKNHLIPNIFNDNIKNEILSKAKLKDLKTFSTNTPDGTNWTAMEEYTSNGLNFIVGLVVPQNSFSPLLQETNSFILSYTMLSIALILIMVLIISVYLMSHSKNIMPDSMTEKDFIDIIQNGENDNTEFKSTLRWNLMANKSGKEMEFAWLKTVAAFLNTQGGLIFIGVDDDGNCLGIENDKFQNEDKFLLHFNNLIKTHIGLEHSNLIHIAIRTVNEQRIFIIKCEPSSKPVFIIHNGQEDFYVRLGPASRELSMSATIKYLQDQNKT